MVKLQVSQAYRVTFYSSIFGVGASFEVFSLTILLTAILLKGDIPAFLWGLIGIYLATGIGFIAFGSVGFRRTRRLQQSELSALAQKYL
ncbi:MAG TPA: hypothetical protein VF956_00430 [Candidatus Dormibacteraeota bacterium]